MSSTVSSAVLALVAAVPADAVVVPFVALVVAAAAFVLAAVALVVGTAVAVEVTAQTPELQPWLDYDYGFANWQHSEVRQGSNHWKRGDQQSEDSMQFAEGWGLESLGEQQGHLALLEPWPQAWMELVLSQE